MMQRIQRFGIAQTAKVFAILYGLMGLLFAPFFLLGGLFAQGEEPRFGMGLAIAIPILYAVLGFVFVAIACWLYNLVASWVGGIEIEVGSDAEVGPETV
jgi:hypothetical protein